MRIMLLFVRLLVAAAGLALLYLAAFTYETTDKRIQSKLEDLWLGLAYYRGTPAGIANRVFRAALALTDRVLDRVFGGRQLSIRTVAVALSFAFGAVGLSFLPLSLFATLADVDVGHIYFVSDLVFLFGGGSSLWGLGLFILLALSVVVLLHLAAWPTIRWSLMRALYFLQRHGVIQRKALLWSMGGFLLGYAVAPSTLGELATRVIRALA